MGAAELTQMFADLNRQESSSTKTNAKISLAEFADLTGFPLAFIKKELLVESDEIELESLRDVMLSYLDKSFN